MQNMHETCEQLDQNESFLAVVKHGDFEAAAPMLGKKPQFCPAG